VRIPFRAKRTLARIRVTDPNQVYLAQTIGGDAMKLQRIWLLSVFSLLMCSTFGCGEKPQPVVDAPSAVVDEPTVSVPEESESVGRKRKPGVQDAKAVAGDPTEIREYNGEDPPAHLMDDAKRHFDGGMVYYIWAATDLPLKQGRVLFPPRKYGEWTRLELKYAVNPDVQKVPFSLNYELPYEISGASKTEVVASVLPQGLALVDFPLYKYEITGRPQITVYFAECKDGKPNISAPKLISNTLKLECISADAITE